MTALFLFLGIGLGMLLVTVPAYIPHRAWWTLATIAMTFTVGGLLASHAPL